MRIPRLLAACMAPKPGLPADTPSWRDRLLEYRDSRLGNPRFQRLAARFPLTRPIARREAQALFDLCAGFVYSQILHAAVKLRLFEHLAGGPQTLQILAAKLSLPTESARRLLDASCALRLAEPRGDDRYGLGRLGATLVNSPGMLAMVEHHAMLYRDLQDPVSLLGHEAGETELQRFWSYARNSSVHSLSVEQVASYSALMASSQAFLIDEILDAYPFDRHRVLLDIGGGDGSFLKAVAARAPNLKLILFDLPAVTDLARARFAAERMESRVECIGGNFLDDPLPKSADLVTLIRVAHDHDDAAVLALFKAARATLRDEGTLLVAEPMSGGPGRGAAAYFEFYLLAMGQGRPRSAIEIERLLQQAGFKTTRTLSTRMPLLVSLVIGRVP